MGYYPQIAYPQTVESPQSSGSRLLASFLSALVPGMGQWILELPVSAAILSSGFLEIFVFFAVFRVPAYYFGLVLLIWGIIILNVVSTCMALRSQSPRARPGSGWWIPLLLFFAMFSTMINSTWLLRVSGFKSVAFHSVSMEPTMKMGDVYIVDLRAYRQRSPQRGDITVYERNNHSAVARVIGVAGDTVSSEDGIVSINGMQYAEPFAIHQNGSDPDPEMNDFGPVKVPPGKLFVMGDNRDESLDSRSEEVGLVDVSEVRGRPLYVVTARHGRPGSSVR